MLQALLSLNKFSNFIHESKNGSAMIQRLHSVFLVLAATFMALLFTRPMSFVTIDQALPSGAAQSMLADGIFSIQDHII
jgi:hypothetical protein